MIKTLGKEATAVKPSKENQEVKKTALKSNIPGLPEEEISKAQKKKKQKDKKQKEKKENEKEKLKDIENKKAEANLLSSNSPGKAFLSSTQNSGSELETSILVESSSGKLNDFEFIDYADNKFEDSK